MLQKLIINKISKRTIYNELIDVAYNKLKVNKNNNNKIINDKEIEKNFYHEIFYFYKYNTKNNLAANIYTIFPSINFEFKYKVTKEGGLGGAKLLLEESICWLQYICEKDTLFEEEGPVNLYL